jgi:nitrate reductase gamma subunit
MSGFLYLVAYLSLIACIAIMLKKIMGYRKKPVHLRWELYPVPHETKGRAAHGGGYLEESGWWRQKQCGSLFGTLKAFLLEALSLHSTYKHNPPLWRRSYPFHIGLYLLIGALGLTLICSLMLLGGYTGRFFKLCFDLGFLCGIVGYLGVLGGCISLLLRRLNKPDLLKFSLPEHFYNLCLFITFAVLGLAMILHDGTAAMMRSVLFFSGMLSFRPMPTTPLYALYILLCCFLFVWVPFSFMGHAFMKYFTWHDIRWGDQPTQDNPAIQAQMARTLQMPVSWKAPHIQGDGRKNWAEVATTNPARDEE